MANWTIGTLRALDIKYAKEGLHPHQRPFRAAVDILGAKFAIGVFANPDVQRIMDAYKEMLPEVDQSWPGMGTGIAAVIDQVRRVTAPVVFGSVRFEVWQALDFKSAAEWWKWCREDRDLVARTSFAVADLLDFAYGLNELQGSNPDAERLWKMAASNLSDVANTLPGTFSVDSVIQPICLTAELSLKAALVQNGGDPGSFGRKGGEGHDLLKLAARLQRELPHRDDPTVASLVSELPPYVQSRYAPAGLTRLKVVQLALGVQFIAASSVRRFSTRDLATEMENGGWPGPRPDPFA